MSENTIKGLGSEDPDLPSKSSQKKTNNQSNQDELLLKQIKELQERLAKIESQSTSSVDKLVSAVDALTKNNQSTNNGGRAYEPIDPDDYTEQPTVFFAFSSGFIIADDVRKGSIVFPPTNDSRGIVEFKYDSTRRKQNGKETVIVNMCRFDCHSKKLSKWLQDHSQHGIRFFSNIDFSVVDEGMNEKAVLMAKYSTAYNNMTVNGVVSECVKMGIEPHPDKEVMVSKLVSAKADAELKRSQEASKRILEETHRAMLMKNGQV